MYRIIKKLFRNDELIAFDKDERRKRHVGVHTS